MKNIDFEKASFKDFEGMDPYGWAKLWGEYVTDRSKNGQFNYRQENLSGCGPEIELNLPSNPHRNFVSLVSNDYLGFTQHPKVKAAAIAAIEKYGTGAGASCPIGNRLGIPLKLIRRSAAIWKCVPPIIDQGVLGGLTRYSGAN